MARHIRQPRVGRACQSRFRASLLFSPRHPTRSSPLTQVLETQGKKLGKREQRMVKVETRDASTKVSLAREMRATRARRCCCSRSPKGISSEREERPIIGGRATKESCVLTLVACWTQRGVLADLGRNRQDKERGQDRHIPIEGRDKTGLLCTQSSNMDTRPCADKH